MKKCHICNDNPALEEGRMCDRCHRMNLLADANAKKAITGIRECASSLSLLSLQNLEKHGGNRKSVMAAIDARLVDLKKETVANAVDAQAARDAEKEKICRIIENASRNHYKTRIKNAGIHIGLLMDELADPHSTLFAALDYTALRPLCDAICGAAFRCAAVAGLTLDQRESGVYTGALTMDMDVVVFRGGRIQYGAIVQICDFEQAKVTVIPAGHDVPVTEDGDIDWKNIERKTLSIINQPLTSIVPFEDWCEMTEAKRDEAAKTEGAE